MNILADRCTSLSQDLTSRWLLLVASHQDFESRIAECSQWLGDVRNKLGYCSDLSASSQKDLDSKMETIQDLLLYKEEGFSKVQALVELAQTVLANTAPAGHQAINDELARLQEEWSALASKMVETKVRFQLTSLCRVLSSWSSFLSDCWFLVLRRIWTTRSSAGPASWSRSTISTRQWSTCRR